jgi:plastocyanin
MNSIRIHAQRSLCLLAAILFLFSCTNSPEKGPNETNEKETTQTNAQDTTQTVSQPEQDGHLPTVEIKGMKFNPEELTVHKGDTVLWINNDLTNHCITEAGKKWTSSAIAPGSSWKKVITDNTDYFCAIHLVMKGRIIVQ